MASQPTFPPHPKPLPHKMPYCSDPNCEYCKDLREMEEAIRVGQRVQGNGKVGL